MIGFPRALRLGLLLVAIGAAAAYAQTAGFGTPTVLTRDPETFNGSIVINGASDRLTLTVKGSATQTDPLFGAKQNDDDGVFAIENDGSFVSGIDGTAPTADSIVYIGGNLNFRVDSATDCTDTGGCVVHDISTATANVTGSVLNATLTANVSGVAGLEGRATTTGVNLTGNITGVRARVVGNGAAGDTGFFFGYQPQASSVHANSNVVAYGSFDADFDADYVVLDKAGTYRQWNTAGNAEPWNLIHDDAVGTDANGATMYTRTSSGTGTGLNGGRTVEIGNTASGGQGTDLLQCLSGQDLWVALCDSAGGTNITIGNATAGITLTSATLTAANVMGSFSGYHAAPVEGAAFAGAYLDSNVTINGVTASWAVAGSGGATGVQFQVTCGGVTATCATACTVAANTPTRCTLTANNGSDQVCTVMITAATDCAANPTGIMVNVDYNYAP